MAKKSTALKSDPRNARKHPREKPRIDPAIGDVFGIATNHADRRAADFGRLV